MRSSPAVVAAGLVVQRRVSLAVHIPDIPAGWGRTRNSPDAAEGRPGPEPEPRHNRGTLTEPERPHNY